MLVWQMPNDPRRRLPSHLGELPDVGVSVVKVQQGSIPKEGPRVRTIRPRTRYQARGTLATIDVVFLAPSNVEFVSWRTPLAPGQSSEPTSETSDG